jgi:hypothetical protein
MFPEEKMLGVKEIDSLLRDYEGELPVDQIIQSILHSQANAWSEGFYKGKESTNERT